MSEVLSSHKVCPICFRRYPAHAERCTQDGAVLVAQNEADLSGQILDDRYMVLQRIGKGGMGVVYKAEHRMLKRIVALKVLRREVVQDETAIKRFMVEAQAIASLDSPHTVTLYDFGVTSHGLLYYTMELLKGLPLSKLIKQNGPMDVRRASELVMQVCDSLEEAHERSILHRDMKPDNLFVVTRRGREEIKVLDFGIAKMLGEGRSDSMTATGMVVGSPQYLSPEQAQGIPVLPASDLYSLGIVLYEMLAGAPPFQSDTPMRTIWSHVKDAVPPLESKNPKVKVPASIEAFLFKALAKEPEQRFQSVAEFRDGLQATLEDNTSPANTVNLRPLSAPLDSKGLRTASWNTVNSNQQPQDTQTPQPTPAPAPPVIPPGPHEDSGPLMVTTWRSGFSTLAAGAIVLASLLALGLFFFFPFSPSSPEPTLPSLHTQKDLQEFEPQEAQEAMPQEQDIAESTQHDSSPSPDLLPDENLPPPAPEETEPEPLELPIPEEQPAPALQENHHRLLELPQLSGVEPQAQPQIPSQHQPSQEDAPDQKQDNQEQQEQDKQEVRDRQQVSKPRAASTKKAAAEERKRLAEQARIKVEAAKHVDRSSQASKDEKKIQQRDQAIEEIRRHISLAQTAMKSREWKTARKHLDQAEKMSRTAKLGYFLEEILRLKRECNKNMRFERDYDEL